MDRIKPVASLQEFFKDTVADAISRQHLDVDDHTQYYVVNLLTIFARSEALFEDGEDGAELKPIAKILAEAVESNQGGERNYALQRVGDVSLFVAGFLGDGFAARLVNTDYYIKMGESAYAALASNVRGSPRGVVFGPVFTELAEKFPELVDVLADIRDDAYTSQGDFLRLYENWVQTGSKRAAKLLRSMGVEPCVNGNGATRH